MTPEANRANAAQALLGFATIVFAAVAGVGMGQAWGWGWPLMIGGTVASLACFLGMLGSAKAERQRERRQL